LSDEPSAYDGAGAGEDLATGMTSTDGTDATRGDEMTCDDVFDRCGTESDDSNYLRRLVSALEFRVGRKRILAKAVARYSPLREAFTRSGDELYAATMEGGDYDEKVG
jgi:uncharacterized membrane-anchored protein